MTVLRLELERDLAQAVLSLPERERRLVGLHFYQGLSLREAARQLELPYATAHDALQKALGRLRAELAEGHQEPGAWRLILLPIGLHHHERGRMSRALRTTSNVGMTGMSMSMIGSSIAALLVGALTLGSSLEDPIEGVSARRVSVMNAADPVAGVAGAVRVERGLPPQEASRRSQDADETSRLQRIGARGIRASFSIPSEERGSLVAFCFEIRANDPVEDGSERLLRVYASRRTRVLEPDQNSVAWLDLEPGTYCVGLLREPRIAHSEIVSVGGDEVNLSWTIPPLERHQVVVVRASDSKGDALTDLQAQIRLDSRSRVGLSGSTPFVRSGGSLWLIPTYEAEEVLSGDAPGRIGVILENEALGARLAWVPSKRREVAVRFEEPVELEVRVADSGDVPDDVVVTVRGGGEQGESALGGTEPLGPEGTARFRLQPGLYQVSAKPKSERFPVPIQGEGQRIYVGAGKASATVRLEQ